MRQRPSAAQPSAASRSCRSLAACSGASRGHQNPATAFQASLAIPSLFLSGPPPIGVGTRSCRAHRMSLRRPVWAAIEPGALRRPSLSGSRRILGPGLGCEQTACFASRNGLSAKRSLSGADRATPACPTGAIRSTAFAGMERIAPQWPPVGSNSEHLPVAAAGISAGGGTQVTFGTPRATERWRMWPSPTTASRPQPFAFRKRRRA